MEKADEFLKAMYELASKGKGFAVATVVRTYGSTLSKPGFKAIIDSEGNLVFGSLGGACPESAISEAAMDSIKERRTHLVKVFLEDVGESLAGSVKVNNIEEVHVETNCGGNMEVFVEPYAPPERLVVISDGGHNEVAESLCSLASGVGFRVEAVDPSGLIKGALKVHRMEDISEFDFNQDDYVVLVTMGRIDIPALYALSKKPVKFVGLMGSKKRITEDLEKLRERGVPASFIESVHAPVGADIGSQTPQEIALSILAEVVAVKRGKHLPHKQ